MSGPGCTGDPRLVGDPVDTLTGAVTDRMLDFRLTGPVDLVWYRYYDSSCAHRSFACGLGSAHAYDVSLQLDGDEVQLEQPVGRRLCFPRLEQDGADCALHGVRLLRVFASCYRLFGDSQPAMEFNFPRGRLHARLNRLMQDDAEVVFAYDTEQRLIGIVDSTGRRIAAAEDAAGRLVRLTVEPGPSGAGFPLIAYVYDDNGNLVATQDTHGNGYAFRYDAANRMLCRRGRKGFQFYFRYDSKGRCVRAMGDGRLYGVALEYTVQGRVTTVTRPDLGRWTYRFSPQGQVDTVVDPLGGEQRFVRDPSGRVALAVDPNGNVTRFVYNPACAPVGKVDSLGHISLLPEDPNAPDPMQHRVAANPAEYEFGSLVNCEQIAPPDEMLVLRLGLAQPIRSLVRTGPGGTAPTTNGFPVRPLGARWWPPPRAGRVFSDLGKLVGQDDDFGRSRSWTYDQSGNVSQYRDFDGSEWQRDYGTWHLLLGLANPLGHELRYTYTPYGEIASFTDAGGAVSEYVYDLTDKLIEVWRCGVLKERYTRDAAGNLIAKQAGDGRELLRIEIGNGNLPARMVVSTDQPHAYRRDAQGRILEVETAQSVIAFAYDKLGNRTEDRRDGLGVSHVFRSRRRPTETRLFDQFVIRYEAAGDSLILTDPMGQRHQLRFPGHGLAERHFAGGTRETAQYDRLGRCLFKYIQHKGGETWSRRYDWSGEGELRSVKDSTRGDRRYDYDAAHRLLRAYVRGEQATFTMDAADNLLVQPGLEATQFIEGNRLAAANGCAITYNDRNAIDRRGGPSGETRYIYDGRDQLVRVEQPNGVFEATYDGIGRRTRTVWNGQVTEFYWNTDQLIAEKRSDGTLRIYIYPDPLALTPMLLVEYDGVDAPPESGHRYVVLSDQIGTPLLAEDEDGGIVWRAEIAPFGMAALWPKNAITLNLRFPGHYFDPETGLHYNRFRYYDPQLGRYIQSDPWGIAGGYNLYAYPANPLLDVDVRGLGEENDKKCKSAKEDPDADEKAAQKALKGDIAAGEDLGLIDKPEMAPNFEKWANKGGSILLSEDGSITYTRKDGVSVTYRDGYPDFSPHEVDRVQIQQSTDRSADFAAANQAAGHPEWGNQSPPGYTWHHNEDGTTMQLVPRDIHSDFTHSGGVSNVGTQQ